MDWGAEESPSPSALGLSAGHPVYVQGGQDFGGDGEWPGNGTPFSRALG